MAIEKSYKVFVTTLGCPKNEVDSEIILRGLRDKGWEITTRLSEASTVLINTCAFIEPARAESIEEIYSFVHRKESGRLGSIIVTGCLAERYGALLADEIPEIDVIIGNRDVDAIPNLIIEGLQTAGTFYSAPKEFSNDWYNTPTDHSEMGWGYVKISEGCDNRCSYCSIPGIKGGLRSAPIESVVNQARHLVEKGAREIVLIGQDTTAYGHDRNENLLPNLLQRISNIDGDFWIRVLYAHPAHLTDENIGAITQTPKVVPYLEVPIQHIAEPILNRMGRKIDSKGIRERIAKLRRERPEIALRTSLIVGFPGETDEDFEELAEYMDEGNFIHGGVFSYSREDGTPAANFPEEVDERTIETRKQMIEMIFDGVRLNAAKAMQDKVVDVIVERDGTRQNMLWGRTIFDAPKIDRTVRFRGSAKVGDIVRVRIMKGTEFHFLGVQE
jgi:ribosomal protein S12 methylthiotransferase